MTQAPNEQRAAHPVSRAWYSVRLWRSTAFALAGFLVGHWLGHLMGAYKP